MKDFETKKAIADKLSVLLPVKSEAEKDQAIALLKELGYAPSTEIVKRVDVNDLFPSGHIGIYKPESVDGEIIYHRDINYIDRWTFFADIPTLVQKTDKKRVVLLGESVARGFLLDPEYTPAMVLDKLVNANSSHDKFDIVDLAETNLTMRGIRNRFIQCLALQPDLVVFLAGNNWYQDFLDEIVANEETFKPINDALKNIDNIGDIKPHLEKVLQDLVIDFLTFVSQKMKEHTITVIMAIPEFNLVDFRSSPGERRMTYLSGDKMRRWSEAREKAQVARLRSDLEQVEIYAQEMIDVDSSHPLGYEMLGDVKMAHKEYDAARELFELGRDTAFFCRSNAKPRMFQITRRTILEHAPKLGIQVLDIAAVFKLHLNGKVPGKDLFLDYCHFTVEGIQVAMEPLADQVLALTGNQGKRALQASDIKPSKHVVALGYLFASIHNAHWGQSYDLYKYYCQRALEASKEIAKTMVYYCDMMSRKVSNNLTRSLEMIVVGNTQIDRYGHALIHANDFKMMEIDLVNAMVNALALRGIDLVKFVAELRKKEHGVGAKTIDLLKKFYYATSFDAFLGSRPAFFEARDTQSTFFLVADKGISVDLFISFRVPSAEWVGSEVEFWVNGVKFASLPAASTWNNHELTIPGKQCKDGVNELVISWPVPKTVAKKPYSKVTDFSSVLNSMYYVFGEINHFSATGVKETVSRGVTVAEGASA
jgi:hypothetical protein